MSVLSCALNRAHAQAIPFIYMFMMCQLHCPETFILLHKSNLYTAHSVPLSFSTINSSSGAKEKKKNPDLSHTPLESSGQIIRRNIQFSLRHTYKHWFNFLWKIIYLWAWTIYLLWVWQNKWNVCIQKNNKPKTLIKHYQIYCAIHFGFSFKESKRSCFHRRHKNHQNVFILFLACHFPDSKHKNKGPFSLDYHNSSAS